MELKLAPDLTGVYSDFTVTNGDVVGSGIEMLVGLCHAASFNRGWWHDPITKLSLIPTVSNYDSDACGADYDSDLEAMVKSWFPYVIATKIALIHSETSEGLEAFRVSKMDDKIPAFAGITAEMADVVIRVADLMGCLEWAAANGILVDLGADEYRATKYSLSHAIMAKVPFNAGRADHSFAKRAELGQKLF